MKLPTTYYDAVIKRDPAIIDFVSKDIAELERKGPFGSTDDFSKYFKEYFHYIASEFAKDIVDRLHRIGITNENEIDQHLHEFEKSPEFRNFHYSKHSDYLMLINFENFGKKTFHINHNLVENLYQTNLDVDSDLLQLPFETCLFVYNSKVAIQAFYSFQKEAIEIDFSTPLSIFAYSLPAEEGKRKILFACWHANDKRNYSFVKRELLIRDGWNIEKTLQTDWEDIYSGGNSQLQNNIDHSPENDGDNLFYEDGLMFFRILVNTILYISSSEPMLTEVQSQHAILLKKMHSLRAKTKKRKIKNKLKKISKLDFTEVGGNTQPIVIEKNSKDDALGKNKTDRILGKRFIVRGHWRQQSCGIMLSGRKLIWIKPYYKGPEMADLVTKPYLVK